MDKRPVGFLDSGLGGVSVLGEALRVLPEENFIYFGDTRNIPYGDKPPETVYKYTHAAVDRLTGLGCKAIVIACNTATSVAAARLRQEMSLPIIGMEPALKPASLLPGSGRVLVMATRNTIKLPKFQALMALYGKDALPLPCSGLMECVESGELTGPRVEGLLEELFAPYANENIKAVVLGCTHYPFLRKTISRFFPPDTALVDGNLGTVRQLRRRLEEEDLLSAGPGGNVTFLSSLDGEAPIRQMQNMLHLWQHENSRSNFTANERRFCRP